MEKQFPKVQKYISEFGANNIKALFATKDTYISSRAINRYSTKFEPLNFLLAKIPIIGKRLVADRRTRAAFNAELKYMINVFADLAIQLDKVMFDDGKVGQQLDIIASNIFALPNNMPTVWGLYGEDIAKAFTKDIIGVINQLRPEKSDTKQKQYNTLLRNMGKYVEEAGRILNVDLENIPLNAPELSAVASFFGKSFPPVPSRDNLLTDKTKALMGMDSTKAVPLEDIKAFHSFLEEKISSLTRAMSFPEKEFRDTLNTLDTEKPDHKTYYMNMQKSLEELTENFNMWKAATLTTKRQMTPPDNMVG